jgi:predicted transport protein
MIDKMVHNLEESTGVKLDEWVARVNASGLEKHMEKVKHLKTEYGLTHGYANLIVHTAKSGLPSKDTSVDKAAELIDSQYAKKADLKPIYDKLIEAVSAFGPDVEIAPKKDYVSLRRKTQFGLIQPSTKTRLDVGICHKKAETTDRLEMSGSFNSMASHRVRVTDIEQVDRELIDWLKASYEAAG